MAVEGRDPAFPGLAALGELADRARDGGDEALERLVSAAARVVRRWALVRLAHAADADDVMQEVMIRVIRSIETWPAGESFAPWLYVVTRNAATDRLRRGGRQRDVGGFDALLDQVPAPGGDPSLVFAGRELAGLVGALLRELPPRQREVFDLVELQGMTAKEVAQLIGIRASSVRGSLLKARRNLRRRILATWPDVEEDLP
ncbi:MAG: RNA polymerase sigma factor [Gammaproteobacteria bacterium]|nr:RNA polymerase sigma factor [Gammaproteobacteria bacterium]